MPGPDDGERSAASSEDADGPGAHDPDHDREHDRDGHRQEPDRPESFKNAESDADTDRVSDVIGMPRWNWNSVTDAGGAPPAGGSDRSGFQFDLGNALSRLGSDEMPLEAEAHEPPPAPAPPRPEPAVVEPPSDLARALSEVMTPPPAAPAAVDPASVLDRREPRIVPDPTALAGTPAVPTFDELPRRTAPPPIGESPSTSPIVPPAAEDLPRRQAAPAPEPLPEIREATPIADPVRPYAAPRRSVFEDDPGIAPNLPSAAPALPSATAPAVARVPEVPAIPAVTAPTLPTAPATPSGSAMPTLPVAAPAAPPPMIASVETNLAGPDVRALRSAQVRAAREQKRGRLFGRTLLAIFVLGGLVAAALVFGRSYLFPTEWDASLTPIVDEFQQTRGFEFDHPVPLVLQNADAYATTVLNVTMGDDWAARLAQWRALGIASGNPSALDVGAALAARIPVVYDPASDKIYQSASSTTDDVTAHLRIALEQVYEAQAAGGVSPETGSRGFTGLSDPGISVRAIDQYLAGVAAAPTPTAAAESAAGASTAADEPTADTPGATREPDAAPVATPLPIAYEVDALDRLGLPILRAVGADPGALRLGGGYPPAVLGVLDDAPARTTPATLTSDQEPTAEAAAVGVDDWSLVWGARLPAGTVERLVAIVEGDSFQPFTRSSASCVTGVFSAGDEAKAAELFAAMTQWATKMPVESGASATQLGPKRVQIESCDPGADVDLTIDAAAAAGLVDRQIARIGR